MNKAELLDQIIDAWLIILRPTLTFDQRVGFITACVIKGGHDPGCLFTSKEQLIAIANEVYLKLRARQNTALHAVANQPEPPPPAAQIKAQTPATPARTATQIRTYIARQIARIDYDPEAPDKILRLTKELETIERKES